MEPRKALPVLQRGEEWKKLLEITSLGVESFAGNNNTRGRLGATLDLANHANSPLKSWGGAVQGSRSFAWQRIRKCRQTFSIF